MAKEKESEKKNKIGDTMRLHVSETRINDAESLDTSFLEGREQKKVVKDQHEKEKILSKSGPSIDMGEIFKLFLSVFFLFLLLGVAFTFFYRYEDLFPKKVELTPAEEEKIVYKMDDNYLFIGDFYTEDMNFEDFSYPYVKVSDEDMHLRDILDDMKESVYVYNPSVVVLQLGMVDLIDETSEEEILQSFTDLIQNIHRNRSFAKIYVESLYPLDIRMSSYPRSYSKIDKEVIIAFNEKLKELVSSLDATYIDMYEALSEDEVLKSDYTEDGLHLTEDGYRKIFKVLKKEMIG